MTALLVLCLRRLTTCAPARASCPDGLTTTRKAWLRYFLRLLLAYEFGEAGLEKLNGENWFVDLTFPFPVNLLSADISWTLVTGLEVIVPMALILSHGFVP